ncbi:phosphotransferase [Corynebacterium sp. H127]|uniref:phosphotransferase n=1 Tax=Corynebacterium sp. H127 TaxID=3133418 RepID=UPI0030A61299
MYESIAAARFFRAKQTGITSLTELRSTQVGPARWVLADVDGYLYQLVLSDDHDVLTAPDLLLEVQRAFESDAAFGAGEMHVISPPLLPKNAKAKVSTAEQSNTSMVFSGEGSPAIAKFFRLLEPGINPEVELLAGLAQQQCVFVPALRGYSTLEWEGETYVTAMIQDFAADSQEGWDKALHFASESRSFAHEAGYVGTALRGVHRDLAAAFGTQTVPAEQVVRQLEQRLDNLVAQASVLAPYRGAIRAAYKMAAQGSTEVQRIHGDAHLGQILCTPDRYLFIDFEGEPARPLAERRGNFSPLQDLAGLIRSFGYAAHFTNGLADPEGWAAECSAAMLESYGIQPSPLLDALVLDKALYEVVYEANNRPDWIHIPLEAVKRLVTNE